MIDERDLLEREIQRFQPQPDLTDRVYRRREKKQRNERIRAGSFAIIVAFVTFAALLRALTPTARPADPPEPSPMALGSLAYALDGDIYVADPDGSNAVKIADGISEKDCTGRPGGRSYWAEGSMWSPDGRYLAYRYSDCSDSSSRWGVVISGPDGNALATFPTAVGWAIPWSPDSTRVAVGLRGDGTNGAIGIYGFDGVRQTVLTLPPGLKAPGDYEAEWLPDGASLMIAHGVHIPLDGSTPRQLPSDDPRTENNVTFSPDGSRVAYTSDRGLMVAAADGSGARLVDPHAGYGLSAWSPSGDRIAFTSPEDQGNDVTTLRVLDVETGAVTSLASIGASDQISADGRPEFSPAGDRILFSRTTNNGETSLWSIATDGSDLRRLVSGTYQGDWQALDPTH